MKTIFRFVCVVAAIFPVIASASVETLSFTCTSSLVVSQENGYHASCDGDFSFDSGVLQDDTAIALRAAGLLTIGHQVLLKSPRITLDADRVALYGAVNTSVSLPLFPVILPAQDAKINFPSHLQAQIAEFQVIPELNSGAILTTGNNAYLAGIGVGSYPLLNGNLAPTQGGTIVLTNSNGVIVSMDGSTFTNPALIASVPEPSHLSMLALGLLGIGLVARRKAKQH